MKTRLFLFIHLFLFFFSCTAQQHPETTARLYRTGDNTWEYQIKWNGIEQLASVKPDLGKFTVIGGASQSTDIVQVTDIQGKTYYDTTYAITYTLKPPTDTTGNVVPASILLTKSGKYYRTNEARLEAEIVPSLRTRYSNAVAVSGNTEHCDKPFLLSTGLCCTAHAKLQEQLNKAIEGIDKSVAKRSGTRCGNLSFIKGADRYQYCLNDTNGLANEVKEAYKKAGISPDRIYTWMGKTIYWNTGDWNTGDEVHRSGRYQATWAEIDTVLSIMSAAHEDAAKQRTVYFLTYFTDSTERNKLKLLATKQGFDFYQSPPPANTSDTYYLILSKTMAADEQLLFTAIQKLKSMLESEGLKGFYSGIEMGKEIK